MAKEIARKGDSILCPLHGPGIITTGSSTTFINGQAVARVGDSVLCADGSIAIILDNSSFVKIDGKKVAYKGDLTSHGGVITSGSDNVVIL